VVADFCRIKIKCDEAIPSCQQCVKRKSLCPGYAQTFTFSSRHERFTQIADTDISTSTVKSPTRSGVVLDTRRSCDEKTARDSTARPVATAPEPITLKPSCGSASACRGHRESSPQTRCVCVTSTKSNTSLGSNEDLPLLAGHEDLALQMCLSPTRSVCIDYWEPSPTTDLVLCSPAVELHFFGETISRHLSVCDAGDNPLRNVTVAKVRQSALYHSLLKYLTAEYFNTSVVTDEAQSNLQIAKADTQYHLQRAWLGATSLNAPEEVVLATMMFGLSASWDGANQTGAYYYRQALSIYQQMVERMPHQNRLFYDHALMYWWAGLAFVMENTNEALPNPPASTSSDSNNAPISIHPLVGISPQSHRLMGEVGALVYSQRKLALQHCFTSLAGLREQERMLHKSRELEQALLAMQIPGPDVIIHSRSDDDTSATDLCNIAEAYRLCALLLLYRCFPDLLLGTLRFESDIDQNSRDHYMSARATEALSVIERNGVTSRTKSVEQLLLLIIAGELTLPNREDGSPISAFDQEGTHADQHATSPSGSCTSLEGEIITAPTDTLAARALVCTRMSAIRNILPYRSVEQAEELMWDVWWRADNGEQIFWMDLMIQRGLRFVMV
jgi:hypothetical protein